MYTVKLSEVYSLPACRTEYQVGDSYCAWSKIACSALDTREITTSPSFSLGLGEMPPKVMTFFSEIQKAVGVEKFVEVIDINDEMEGRFSENHERALKLALQLATEGGVIEIADEDSSLVKELREQVNACGSYAGISA